jgi:glycosyltransferase involved in cell wall biosynthesis
MIGTHTSLRISMIGTRGVPAQYGGFETAVEEVGQRLAARGHEVHVYCRNQGQSLADYKGMHLINLPAVRHRHAETVSHASLSVAHTICVTNPDVVILFNAANAPLVSALRAARIPVAVHVDGLEWQRQKWRGAGARYYRWAEKRSAGTADALIADARGIADHLHASYGREPTFIPYGAPIIDPGDDCLAKLNLRPRGFHLVVARFEPENHVWEIVEGFRRSNAALPLVVVGSAPYAQTYTAAIREVSARDPRVRLLGGVWDQTLLDQLYGNCLTYLHGHSVGGTNPSLLRAMGAKAPVTAYDVVFNREVTAGYARLFRMPEGVRHAVEADEDDPAGALERGLQGQCAVASMYRWDDVADGYEQLCWALAVGHGRRMRVRQ